MLHRCPGAPSEADPAKIHQEIEAKHVFVELFGDRDIGSRDGCEAAT
jgi:hypothetical protein